MQIISDYTNDRKSDKPVAGSYEWWYFDGLTLDGKYGIVVIFYEGNPFSRKYIQAYSSGEKQTCAEDYPAISISLYKNGKTVYYGFMEYRRNEAEFSRERIHGRLGECEFFAGVIGGKLVYRLLLDQKLPNGDSVQGALKFESPADVRAIASESTGGSTDLHRWNLVQPRADVKGEIFVQGHNQYEIDFNGPGYHDHNLGLEPMDRSFIEWYWGRIHFEMKTLVYYIMNKKNGSQKQAWLMDSKGNIKSMDDSVILQDKSFNAFGLHTARKINLTGKKIECLIQKEKVIDSGPFYQRFKTRAVLHDGNQVHQAAGIAEYMYPSRIKNRLFWPLVNMRINYPGERDHWVQRSPRLYRWTW